MPAALRPRYLLPAYSYWLPLLPERQSPGRLAALQVSACPGWTVWEGRRNSAGDRLWSAAAAQAPASANGPGWCAGAWPSCRYYRKRRESRPYRDRDRCGWCDPRIRWCIGPARRCTPAAMRRLPTALSSRSPRQVESTTHGPRHARQRDPHHFHCISRQPAPSVQFSAQQPTAPPAKNPAARCRRLPSSRRRCGSGARRAMKSADRHAAY